MLETSLRSRENRYFKSRHFYQIPDRVEMKHELFRKAIVNRHDITS